VRKIIVGFSGGVSSAWCAGWALRAYPKDEVVFLFHDTKEEDEHPVTEVSDGRSVTEIFHDEHAIANNRMAFCSRILKAEQRDRYFDQIRAEGVTEILNVLGFSAKEEQRVQRAAGRAIQQGYACRFPMIEDKITKQQAADWCLGLGVRPPRMYLWSEHANCVGCVRGGKAYWLAVKENAPEIFEQRALLEEEFGHTILKDTTLRELAVVGLKRKVKQREAIEIGPCDCGD